MARLGLCEVVVLCLYSPWRERGSLNRLFRSDRLLFICLDCFISISIMFSRVALVSALVSAVSAGSFVPRLYSPCKSNRSTGTILWDGRFNEFSSSADLNKCKYRDDHVLRDSAYNI